jgi:hypothetical protein
MENTTVGLNTTVGHSGRFCNHVILNMFASLVSERGNTKFIYSYSEEMRRLGLPIFTTGTENHGQMHTISNEDTQFDTLLENPVNYNLNLRHTFVQGHAFALRLFNLFRTDAVRTSIMGANVFKERYGANNSVFVHVRLDDTESHNPGYAYYEKALQALGPVKGYVSSDSPDHLTVRMLMDTFGLEPFQKDEVDTLMFASTCRHLVLSGGTFSWMMGALAFSSSVSVASKKYNNWCNQSFDMPDWKIIEF